MEKKMSGIQTIGTNVLASIAVVAVLMTSISTDTAAEPTTTVDKGLASSVENDDSDCSNPHRDLLIQQSATSTGWSTLLAVAGTIIFAKTGSFAEKLILKSAEIPFLAKTIYDFSLSTYSLERAIDLTSNCPKAIIQVCPNRSSSFLFYAGFKTYKVKDCSITVPPAPDQHQPNVQGNFITGERAAISELMEIQKIKFPTLDCSILPPEPDTPEGRIQGRVSMLACEKRATAGDIFTHGIPTLNWPGLSKVPPNTHTGITVK